jgi:hypothetical protein
MTSISQLSPAQNNFKVHDGQMCPDSGLLKWGGCKYVHLELVK